MEIKEQEFELDKQDDAVNKEKTLKKDGGKYSLPIWLFLVVVIITNTIWLYLVKYPLSEEYKTVIQEQQATITEQNEYIMTITNEYEESLSSYETQIEDIEQTIQKIQNDLNK